MEWEETDCPMQKVFGLKTGVKTNNAESICVIENSLSCKPYNQLGTAVKQKVARLAVTAQLVFAVQMPLSLIQKQQPRDLIYFKVLASSWSRLALHGVCFSWRWTELMVYLYRF